MTNPINVPGISGPLPAVGPGQAAAQGAANKSLAKFRHTASASEKISEHLMDLVMGI